MKFTTILVLLVAALSGCVTRVGGAPPARTATTSAATTTTTSATPTTTTAPPSLTDQPMAAADGNNTDACVDGTCEVLVSPGAQFRVNTNNGGSTMFVVDVGPGGVTLGIAADSGFSSNISSGPGAGEFGEFGEFNGVSLAIMAARGTTGVLRLALG